jgi:hypothetical protein
MSSRQESSASASSTRATHSPVHLTTSSSPLETRGDPLCSENIDAQIRWFFEHVLERERLTP